MLRTGGVDEKHSLVMGVLFAGIQLMMFHIGNRYTVLANLIRHLHDELFHDNVSPMDAERFLLQIGHLCNRLKLTGIIQSCSAISNVLALGAMIAAYFDEPMIASNLFLGSILLMMGLMLLLTSKIQIANRGTGHWTFICPTSRPIGNGNNI